MCAVTAQSAALIVALGDCNTAGYGVSAENAFPARLQAMLRRGGNDVQVANAGIPGDTLRGMLVRLDRYVPQGTRVVIVQGGYNDVMAGASAAALARVSKLAEVRPLIVGWSSVHRCPIGCVMHQSLPTHAGWLH